MKKISEFPSLLLSTICALGLMTCVVSAQVPDSLTNGLVAYYTFEGTINDASGNGRDLAQTNDISFTADRFGNSDGAVMFNSTASYARSADLFGMSGNVQHTVSFWIQAPTIAPFGFGKILSLGTYQGVATDCFYEIDACQVSTANTPGRIFCDSAYAGYDALNLGTDFIQHWNQIVFVYNGQFSTSQIYMNGTALPTTPNYYSSSDQLALVDTVIAVGGNDIAFQGARISDLGIWSTAFSATDVTDLYNAQSVPEPSTYALLLLSGAASIFAFKRRKS